jgi:hypothetical protein
LENTTGRLILQADQPLGQIVYLGTSAIIRAGPPDPPAILIGSATTMLPVGGSWLCKFFSVNSERAIFRSL